MSAQPVPPITPEEYLELDRQADYRSEYFDGQVYAMSGGSHDHSIIIGNLVGELRTALRGTGCITSPIDTRLLVSPTGLYTYPDVVVVCDSTQYTDDRRDTLINPTVIFEVLSPSTELHDRVFKFNQYRKIESLREYILVAQDEPHAETYRRQGDQWLLTVFDGIDTVCDIESIRCRLALSEIYYQVQFRT